MTATRSSEDPAPRTGSAPTTVPRLVPPAARSESGSLRREVREFLAAERAAGLFTPAVDSWLSCWDEDFTAALAARGWIGMTVPVEYGGRGHSYLDRFAVTEELIAAGAPVAAHWVADRQIVPSLLRYGTEQQKRRYLPRIVRGARFFGIGMSEPDAGSDLAGVRTRGAQVEGGWRVSGTKVWTSGAHHADAFIVLARTAPADPDHRHAGLSQFLVELDSPGVDVRLITSMDGSRHFNEVFLDDVFVPDAMVFGRIGDGWSQVMSELAFERSGPERFLSTFPLLAAAIDDLREDRLAADRPLGRMVARVAGLHQMSTAVAGALERQEPADVAAAVVKVVGTATEGDIADAVDLLVGDDGSPGPELEALLADSVDRRPGFTLRGGTNEVLRGVIARGLGLR